MLLRNLISTVIKDKYGYTIDRLINLSMIGLGLVEKIGERTEQEDTAYYELFDPAILSKLSPIEIARRVWTAIHCLDSDVDASPGGSTAAIATYDGKDNLITATLGDSTQFVALYKKDGTPFAVIRLHDELHNGAASVNECDRIFDSGGYIAMGRVNGQLAVTRALADRDFRASGVTANAAVNICSIEQLCKLKGLSLDDLGDVQLLVACDGLTEKISKDVLLQVTAEHHGDEVRPTDKDVQERHILKELQACNPHGKLSVTELADILSTRALEAGSGDNVSVIFHTLKKSTNPFAIALFDGHGGKYVASFAARWVGVHLRRLFSLDEKQYNEEEFSVANHKQAYDADNNKTEKDFLAYLRKKNVTTAATGAEVKTDLAGSENIAQAVAELKKEKEKFLNFFLEELGFDKEDHDNLSKKINEYLESFQRMVLDAKISLTELSQLHDNQLNLLFQHEYFVLKLRNVKWSLEQILTSLELENLTPTNRKEIFKYAFEIRCIANDYLTNSFIGPEQKNDQAFFTHWFAVPEEDRHKQYEKIRLAKNLLENKFMTYRDILTFDEELLKELCSYDVKLIRFLTITGITIHDFIKQKHLFKFHIEKIDDLEAFVDKCKPCKQFTWQDFEGLPNDIVRADYGNLNRTFINIPTLTKEKLFGYDPNLRTEIINKSANIASLMRAQLSLDEILNLKPEKRSALIRHSWDFQDVVNKYPQPEIMKNVLLDVLSEDTDTFGNLFEKTYAEITKILAKRLQSAQGQKSASIQPAASGSPATTPAATFASKRYEIKTGNTIEKDKEEGRCQCRVS